MRTAARHRDIVSMRTVSAESVSTFVSAAKQATGTNCAYSSAAGIVTPLSKRSRFLFADGIAESGWTGKARVSETAVTSASSSPKVSLEFIH